MRRADLARSDFAVAALLFSIGLVVAALAAAVLIAYHDGPQVLRLAGPNHLQYDTAWIVLLCGTSLVAYALRLRGTARLLASGAMLISALRIAGYVAPQAVSVIQSWPTLG